MATHVPCKKNDVNGYVFYVSLVSQANTKIFQANPTYAAGDIQVAVDDGAPANVSAVAIDADFTKRVKITLSQAQTNGDNLTVICSDAAGAEWCDLTINIQTSAQTLDEIDVNVDDIETDTGTTLPATLATIAGYIDTEVQAIIDDLDNGVDGLGALKALIDALNDPTVAAIADAVWDEVLTGATHNIPTSAGRRLRQAGVDAALIREDTCQAGSTASTIELDAAASATDNFYDHMWVYIVTNTGAGQVRTMHEYNGTTKIANIYPDWLTTPDNTSEFNIISLGSSHVHELENLALAQIKAEAGAALTDYDPPTNAEMDAGHGLLATVAKQDIIDGIVDDILEDTGITLPATLAAIIAAIDAITVVAIANAVWDELTADHEIALTFGEAVVPKAKFEL